MSAELEITGEMTTASGEDVYVFPSSIVQKRYWLLDQLKPGDPSLNTPIALHLKGALDPVALEQTLNEILRRHESLRTTFETEKGELVQVIAPTLTIALPVEDLRNLPPPEREAEAKRLTLEEAQYPFDLARGPLFRASLLQLDDEEHILLVTVHHVICDGWSLGLMVREIGAIYEAFSQGRPSPLPELPIQYADFAYWQEQWLQGEDFAKQLTYWKQQLNGHLPVLDLPTDKPRRSGGASPGAIETLLLPQTLTDALRAFCHREDITMFMLFFATFNALLYRYTGQEDILSGSPVANRNQIEIESLIGLFVNVLVLRTDLSGNPSFRELLRRVREVALGAFAHHDMPFDKLIEELHLGPERSSKPLLQVMFIFQKAFMQPVELPNLTLTPQRSVSPGAIFELTQSVVERAEGQRLQLEYNTDLFDPATITRMLENFKILLEAIVADPEQRVSDIPLLIDEKSRRLPVERDDTQTDNSRDKYIHELFEAQVERTPEAVALVCEEKQLTYRELSERADRVARHLQTLGIGPNVLVGLLMERSLEMLVGLLGILKAGGTYVALAPSDKQERLALKMKEAGLSVLLTERRLAKDLPACDARVVFLDADLSAVAAESSARSTGGAQAESLVQPQLKAEREIIAPRDALELQLTEIWENAFGIRPIGVTDNFFDLGGHSLLAVRLFAQIKKLIKNIPLATLFQAPTIEQLANVLRQRGWSAPWTSLVALQPGGSKPPFFCVHAAGGNVLFYRDLARHLGTNQPFYGLQAQGLDGTQPRHTRIEEMASHYVREIRSLQPEGPYYLGGASFGGLIVFEMAQQLYAQGQEVALLALFDTYGPDYPKLMPGITLLRAKIDGFLKRSQHHLGSLWMLEPKEKFRYLWQKVDKTRRIMRRGFKNRQKQVMRKVYSAVGQPLPQAVRVTQGTILHAGKIYEPKVYPGRVTLFRADVQPSGIYPDPTLGWGKLVSGELEIYEVPGYHAAIVSEPRVRILAERLKACLDKAQANESGKQSQAQRKELALVS